MFDSQGFGWKSTLVSLKIPFVLWKIRVTCLNTCPFPSFLGLLVWFTALWMKFNVRYFESPLILWKIWVACLKYSRFPSIWDLISNFQWFQSHIVPHHRYLHSSSFSLVLFCSSPSLSFFHFPSHLEQLECNFSSPFLRSLHSHTSLSLHHSFNFCSFRRSSDHIALHNTPTRTSVLHLNKTHCPLQILPIVSPYFQHMSISLVLVCRSTESITIFKHVHLMVCFFLYCHNLIVFTMNRHI